MTIVLEFNVCLHLNSAQTQTSVRNQPIIALYFEFENELKFHNLEAWCSILYINFKILDLNILWPLLFSILYTIIYNFLNNTQPTGQSTQNYCTWDI